MAEHHILREQELDLVRDEVFDFFARPRNLEAITPRGMHFSFEVPPPADLYVGAEIRHRLVLFGIPVRWRSRIAEWDPPRRFADVQARGPYAYWRHTHVFDELPGGRTRMSDKVVYRLPLGPVGEVARWLFVARQLEALFDYRARTLPEALAAAREAR